MLRAWDTSFRRSVQLTLLLGSTSLAGVCLKPSLAAAQSAPSADVAGARTVAFAIPPQALSGAIPAFSRAAGVTIVFDGAVPRDATTKGVSGTMTPRAALDRLLGGTGLSARFNGASSITLYRTGSAGAVGAVPEGSTLLDTLDVSGVGVKPEYQPYQTPGATSYITQETIDRFRGSSPADIFRGTPGVMSGEPRNGGGGIDVNIRGMQGMGRVAVTIDGAENGLTIYQGYQGISNRTFVDPDLLAGVDIRKGSDASSRGIAGTVAMRTLSADDVVKPGERWGVWVKSGFGTNTTTPRPGDRGGYTWPRPYVSDPQPYPVPTASASGLDRPGWLDPASGSFSTVAAVKEANYDLLWGYAFRKQGNYFAGKNGPGAQVIDTGPQPLCYASGTCYYPPHPISYAHVYQNGGISSYRAGEQVLNTQLETESYLAKGTVRDDNGQSLQVGYTGYRSKAGDVIASLFSSVQSQAVQQAQENTTKLDTGTVRYRWKPDDNDLVDLKANFWLTKLNLRAPPRVSLGVNVKPEDFGLPYNYLPGNDSTMWGGDAGNKSRFSFDRFGSLELDYGLSYLNETTRPIPFTNQLNGGIPSRDGSREEVAGFGKAAYKPVEWLTLNGGLRYSHYRSHDRSVISNAAQANSKPSREDGGYSPSAGVVLEPVKGTQFYANYSNALRMPTLFESAAAYSLIPNPDLRPERSRNWEAGVNVIRDGIFASSDKTMLKLGYFNWDVKDYVARVSRTFIDPTYGFPYTGLQVLNIDRARFEGLEFTGRYENNGFTAELAANYYLNVEYCLTASRCTSSTLSGDYATNQVPPEYSANLTVSQKLLNDDLTIGGRVSYTGPRSVGHGAVQYGAAAIISPIYWNPYVLFDVFTEYKVSKDITLWAAVENLTDQYYVDPLSLIQQPGPGRTARLGLTGKFGGSEPVSHLSLARLFGPSEGVANWSGFYAGAHAAYNFAKFRGQMTASDGSTAGNPGRESPGLDVKALSFGLHAGYNYQFSNRMIVGIEADIAKSEISGSQVTYATEGSSGPFGDNLNRLRQYEAVQRSRIEWLSTVRGRLGYGISDRLMVYATGGVAFMRQSEDRTQYVGAKSYPGLFSPVNTTVAAFTENASITRTGFAIGGGAEFALSDAWSLKGEYLLARFDDAEISFPNARAGVMIANGSGYPVTSSTVAGRRLLSKVDIPMIRVGVNYRF
jgi:hemoglobin/transferrin/lactoferrin receptor protein